MTSYKCMHYLFRYRRRRNLESAHIDKSVLPIDRMKKRRYIFLLLHVTQPALMISIFPDEYIYFIALVGFTIPGSIIVLLLKNAESQQIVAGFILSPGILASSWLTNGSLLINTFGILFMLKLLAGFSVKRPPFDNRPDGIMQM